MKNKSETSELFLLTVIPRSGATRNLIYPLKWKNKILPLRFAQCQNDNGQPLFQMFQSLITAIVLLISSFQLSIAGDLPKNGNLMFSVFLHDSSSLPSGPSPVNEAERVRAMELSSRRTTATIYSCILPGSGQTMLGNTYKGIGFTLVAFGSALTAGISHNNFIARNERLDALEFQYANAATWETSELIYVNMRATHTQLQQDKKRRDLFLVISAVVWAFNIVDIIYFTEDQGQSLFSAAENVRPLQLGTVDSPHNPLFSLSLPLH